jgi:hypothetical protein
LNIDFNKTVYLTTQMKSFDSSFNKNKKDLHIIVRLVKD